MNRQSNRCDLSRNPEFVAQGTLADPADFDVPSEDPKHLNSERCATTAVFPCFDGAKYCP